MYSIRPLFGLMALTIMLFGCGDPTPLGSDLLSQDQEDVFYTDTVTIAAEHFFQDSLLVYNESSAINGLAFGSLEDPQFGVNRADLYLQITPGSLSLPVLNSYDVDSVLLVFEIDSTRSYGNFQDPVDIEVFEMTEMFDPSASYYTNKTFETKVNPLASETIVIDPEVDDRLVVTDGDTLVGRMMKMSLPKFFGERLLDTSVILNFDDEFFGLHVKDATPSPTSSMAVFWAQSSITSINVYYTNVVGTDSTNYLYRYLASPIDVRTGVLQNDITGSKLEEAITTGDDELLFLQGLHGPDLKISFPHIADLGNIVINSAFLNLTVADLPDDDIISYPPASQLIFNYLDENGDFLVIDDVLQGFIVFGGDFEDNPDVSLSKAGRYSLNLSNYFQKIVDGTGPNELYLQVFPKSYDPSRSIIFGNGSLQKPQLELTYTRINP